MKSKENINYLVDTDWFDYQFIEGFLYKDLKIKKKLNEPIYTIGGETISSRVLKHWQSVYLKPFFVVFYKN